MEYSNYILASIITLLLFSACSDDFLNPAPISSRSVENFYKNEKEINQAVLGMYDELQKTKTTNNAILLNERRSDNSFQLGADYAYEQEVITFAVTPNNIQLFPVWSTLYEGIHRCNVVLEQIDGVEFDQEKSKDIRIGETKFIRALMYFDLVRYFGGVPLVTTTLSVDKALEKGRASRKEVYQLIIKDLKDAINKLPDNYSSSSDRGRATVYTAQAFLGKVYMTRSGYPLNTNEWEKAKDLFEEIIQSGKFEFFASYAEVFDVDNDNGKQSVFAIQFNAGVQGEGNPMPTLQAPNRISRDGPLGLASSGSPHRPHPSQDLINSFEEGDLRLKHSIRFKWLHADGTIHTDPWSQKFVSGTPGVNDTWDVNWMVMRYADVLMMYAEALNELSYTTEGKAFHILNDIRIRAGLDSKIPTDVPTQQAFRDWITKERRYEFAFENKRWNYLVRTDRAVAVMSRLLSLEGGSGNIDRDKYIYPIPLRVIKTNSAIKQNPGY